ncbi:MAG: galactosyltransferase-related protein [Mangrovibacterium sp.]
MNKDAIVKPDIQDVTFLIPIRIDSKERRANLETVLKVFMNEFNANMIVLEADRIQRFNHYDHDKIHYHYIFDDNPVFHRTKYINQLLSLTLTPIAAVWDADAIAIPEQVLDAVEQIRQQKAVMSFPYDGRFYAADMILSQLFRQILRYDIFTDNLTTMHLMHGYYSVGGAYVINKKEYLRAGGENENFYGWGPEDAERVRRMEIYDLPVHYTPGGLFHLWHPRGKNSWFANKKIEIQNRQEFLKTCSHKNKMI